MEEYKEKKDYRQQLTEYCAIVNPSDDDKELMCQIEAKDKVDAMYISQLKIEKKNRNKHQGTKRKDKRNLMRLLLF